LPLASLLRFPLADLGESPHGKAQKKIYVGRMVSVITLAPDIVAAILDDTLLGRVTMFDLAADPPAP